MKTSWTMVVGMIALAGLGMVLTTGCQPANPNLTAQANSPIPDVPLPNGFALIEEQSRSRSRGSWRTVDFLYEGSGDKFAVPRFYEEQMPMHGWSLWDKRFIRGRATINFIKNGETCVITVYEEGGIKPIRLHVDISPTAQEGSAPRAMPPGSGRKGR
jgi:hypothetical protein